MKRAILVTERAVVFGTNVPGGTSGTVYNGTVLASTLGDAMDPNTAASGKGIDCSNFYRALITVTCGTVAGDNVISALVGPLGFAADDTDNAAQAVPSFLLNIGVAQSGKIVIGEIFLQAVGVPSADFPLGANSLWIKKTGTDVEISITVTLEDPATEIADGRNTLQDNAVYTG